MTRASGAATSLERSARLLVERAPLGAAPWAGVTVISEDEFVEFPSRSKGAYPAGISAPSSSEGRELEDRAVLARLAFSSFLSFPQLFDHLPRIPKGVEGSTVFFWSAAETAAIRERKILNDETMGSGGGAERSARRRI